MTARLVVAAALTLAVAGCGSSSGSGGSSANAGAKIFQDEGCVNCHTLKAANATGEVGPNLDQLKPTVAQVVKQVNTGGGAMPSFRGKLTPAQIKQVAEYVATSSRKD